MTPDLTPDIMYLAYTAILTAALWIPYIVGQVVTGGMLTPAHYKDVTLRTKDLPAWLERANRAHINAVETFAPFAAVVIAAHISGTANETTATAAMFYFWIRVAHPVVYILGLPYLRTLVFALGFIATLVIGWQIIG